MAMSSSSSSVLFSPPTTTSPIPWRKGAVKWQYPIASGSYEKRRLESVVSSALPETAASIVVTAATVSAAAVLLRKTLKDTEAKNSSSKTCDDCEGSGICSECKGEGFTLKKLSDESAERARLTAKNAATRYTAGLPKKWSYCSKCSSSRFCVTCGGSGLVKA